MVFNSVYFTNTSYAIQAFQQKCSEPSKGWETLFKVAGLAIEIFSVLAAFIKDLYTAPATFWRHRTAVEKGAPLFSRQTSPLPSAPSMTASSYAPSAPPLSDKDPALSQIQEEEKW